MNNISAKSAVLIIVIVFAGAIALAGMLSEPTSRVATPPRVAQADTRSYEVVRQWDIPNGGGEGKLVVIASERANEADLIALGEQLRLESPGKKLVRVSVYTDRKAADLWDKVLADDLTPQEEVLCNTYYVAQYNRNANTGYHELSIFPDGVTGDSKEFAY